VTGTGTGLSQDHTVYGSVPAAQAVPAGDYQDTITVRVYY
jgi:spore coat protein U-like protein